MKLINCLFQFPGSGQTKSWSGRTNWSWEMLSSLHWAGIPRWDAADQRPRDSENKLGQHCSVSEGHGYKRPPVLRLYGCSSNADPDICHGTAPCTQCSGRWRSPNKAGKKGRLQKIFFNSWIHWKSWFLEKFFEMNDYQSPFLVITSI